MTHISKLIMKNSLLLVFALIASQTFAQVAGEDTKVFISNESTINTEFLEYSPAFFEDGIIFISSKYASGKYKIKDTRINKNIMSIFQARRDEGGLLQAPTPFAAELLSTVHEGPMTFNRTNDVIFFTRNNMINGQKKRAKDGILKMAIFTAERVGDSWTNIKALDFNNKESNDVHPTISVDGDILYFASDRPGGIGGMDIWKSHKVGDEWSEPQNMGPGINTESDEIFPFIHADGTLYFASKGLAGFGGLDIFHTSQITGGWSKPANLGKPFNSENDDLGFIIDRDKKNGYFSSNRAGGRGEDDIFSFYISSGLLGANNIPQAADKGIEFAIIDAESGDPIQNASINYMPIDELSLARAVIENENALNQDKGEVLIRIPFGEETLSNSADEVGIVPITIGGASNYVFNIESPGYQTSQIVLTSDTEAKQFLVSLAKDIPISEVVTMGEDGSTSTSGSSGTSSSGSTSTNSSSVIDVESNTEVGGLSSTIREGSVIELPNIYYNFNDASIRPDAKTDLDVVLSLLQKYPDMQIELASHTDARGDGRYNRRLSQKRADNAVSYLVGKGISQNRLTSKGYGEDEVRNECRDGVKCSESGHQYNRRTEVRVTKMSQEINVRFVNNSGSVSSSGSSSGSVSSGSSSSSGKEIQVITGVFKEYKNAEKRQQQCRDAGFTSAEIISNSQGLNTVIAGRYYSSSEAESAASSLRSSNIKAFVKK